MSYAMRQQVQKSVDDRVEAVNRNGHKVWVSKETMKKRPGDFKPAPKDKGHDVHKSEHHESVPKIVKDSFHAKKVTRDEGKKVQEAIKKDLKKPEVKSAWEKLMSHQLLSKKDFSSKDLEGLTDDQIDEVTKDLSEQGTVGSILSHAIGHGALCTAVAGAAGVFSVSATPALIAGAAVFGAFITIAGGVSGDRESISEKIESFQKNNKSANSGVQARFEKMMANPTADDLTLAAKVSDGKGHLDHKKLASEMKKVRAEALQGGGKKSSLRERAIRLAHENPGLRKHLLPLLQEKS